MVDTGLVLQIENERRREEEEEVRNAEDRFWDEYADRAFSSLVAQRRHIEAILKRQKELEEQRDSPNLREHVPRMEK